MSLTVASITADRFAIAIIPHTIEHTNLLAKFVGGQVNLELDVIGKYIERLLALREGREPPADSSVSKGFLAEHGFV
jgi:riboflavin synthase